MSDTRFDDPEAAAGVPAPLTLLLMMTGYWISQAVHVVAKLNVADALAGGPRTGDELAAATGADPLALGRVMRALASVDVFRWDEASRWALRPLGELLRTDRPGSMRPLALMYGGEQYAAWAGLEHSVMTGAAAFPHTFGADYFDYLQAHPDADEVFNEAMTGLSVHLFAAVIESYDFTSFGTIVDVGGSYGALLTTVLRAAPEARGILFDQPHVAAIAAERLAAGDVADRCTTVGGDFFAEVPTGADAYLLSQILHDWDDTAATQILACCRRSIPAGGTLLVVDFVVPETDEPSISTWIDLHMMVLLGARERTVTELDHLLDRAGFRRGRIVPTSAGPSIIEAKPV